VLAARKFPAAEAEEGVWGCVLSIRSRKPLTSREWEMGGRRRRSEHNGDESLPPQSCDRDTLKPRMPLVAAVRRGKTGSSVATESAASSLSLDLTMPWRVWASLDPASAVEALAIPAASDVRKKDGADMNSSVPSIPQADADSLGVPPKLMLFAKSLGVANSRDPRSEPRIEAPSSVS